MVILRFKIHSKPDKSDELMAALAERRRRRPHQPHTGREVPRRSRGARWFSRAFALVAMAGPVKARSLRSPH